MNVIKATGQFVKDVAGIEDEERQPICPHSEKDQREQLALQAGELRFKREQLEYEAQLRQLKMQQAQIDRENTINNTLYKGNAALERGEYQAAWVQFNEILKIDSYNSEAMKGARIAQEKLGQKAIEEGDYLKALRAFVRGGIDLEIRSTFLVLMNRAKMEETRVEDLLRSHSLDRLRAALKVYEESNRLCSEMKQIFPRDRFPEELSVRSDSIRLKIDQLKDKIHLIEVKNQAAAKVKKAQEQLEVLQKEYDAKEYSMKEIIDLQKQLEEIRVAYEIARSIDPNCSIPQEERLESFLQEVDANLHKSNLTHLQKSLEKCSLKKAQDLGPIIHLCKSWEASYQKVRKSRYIDSAFKLKVKPVWTIIQQIALLANFAKTKLSNLEQDFSRIVNQAIQFDNSKGEIAPQKLEVLKKEYRAVFNNNEQLRNMYVALNEEGRMAFEGILDSQLVAAVKKANCLCLFRNQYKFSPMIPFSEKSLYDALYRCIHTSSIEDIDDRLGRINGARDYDEEEGRQVEGQQLQALSTVSSALLFETTR